MEIQFQLAKTGDTNVLLNFIEQFYAIDQYPFDKQVVHEALQPLLEDASLGRLWLIKDGTEAVGYVVVAFSYSLEFHGLNAFIDEFFLTAPYRGQGIGKQTLQFVEKECRHLGIHALHLEVEHTNETGLALYRKTGFQAHDHRYLMTKFI